MSASSILIFCIFVVLIVLVIIFTILLFNGRERGSDTLPPTDMISVAPATKESSPDMANSFDDEPWPSRGVSETHR